MSNGSTTWSIRLRSSRTSGQTTGAWRLFATRGEAIEFGAARLRDATGHESDPVVVDVPPGPHARVLDRNGQLRVEVRKEGE